MRRVCSFGLSAVRQSSNIYFTNGVYDPFIACGPTVDISETITAQVYGMHSSCAAAACLFVQLLVPLLHARLPAAFVTRFNILHGLMLPIRWQGEPFVLISSNPVQP